MSHNPGHRARLRTRFFAQAKENSQAFACLTSYDCMTAEIFDEAGVDLLLVGDSLANVVLGRETTLSLTLDEMIPLARAVVSATSRAFVVVDLPFGSYEAGPAQALESAVRVMKETGAQAVKLEGGAERAPIVAALVAAGIPVCAHIGFTPQQVHALGGFVVQGRGAGAEKLHTDARALADAGAFAVVLEMVPAALAEEVTKELPIPTIGIGAGAQTDGQILVWTDAFGLGGPKAPRFVRRYADLRGALLEGAKITWPMWASDPSPTPRNPSRTKVWAMQIFKTKSELRAFRAAASGTVGLVPTMGALHEGHASLVRRAREENDTVVCSVFVNPLQFTDLGDCEDYRAYPRDLDADAALLDSLGVDAVFAPSVEEMYPGGTPRVWVRTGEMGSVLEGASRPGHFDGVATVVSKLFTLVRPDRAYFGQKDAQQVAIIRRLVADLDLPLDIISAPIVRAADGVAESSRNSRLSPLEREQAVALSQALFALRDGASLDEASAQLASSPGVTVDYLTVVDPATLEPIDAQHRSALALVAAQVGPVRLIDNLVLES